MMMQVIIARAKAPESVRLDRIYTQKKRSA